MDFSVADTLADHRAAARLWAENNIRPEWASEQHRTGTHQTEELHQLLAQQGILGAGWPPEYGGTDVSPAFATAIFDEIVQAGLYADGWATTNMVIRTIEQLGSEQQKRSLIPAALKGELMIALGYSEPDSGSDVAAAKTRAVRDGDQWIINGQKVFTSTAQVSTHVFLLTRTDPDAPKHKGLTMFLAPTSAEGFDMQPIHTLGGQRTNATFYTDLCVPDDLRIGGVNEGWSVMHVALVFERGGGRTLVGPTLSARMAEWAQAKQVSGRSLYDSEPSTPERLARMAIDEEVARLLAMRVRWISASGGLPGVEGSIHKLFASEALQRHHSELLDLLGPEAVLQTEDAPMNGAIEASFRSAVVGTIYGGSTEIQREIIAERRLGLPKSRPST
jgi:3-oxocholest-4-en-26-oyl-CoA dehydrogenase alpha subunit